MRKIIFIFFALILPSCGFNKSESDNINNAKAQITQFYKALSRADGAAILPLLDTSFFVETDAATTAKFFNGWPHGELDSFVISNVEETTKITSKKKTRALEVFCRTRYRNGKKSEDSFFFFINENGQLSKIVECEFDFKSVKQ